MLRLNACTKVLTCIVSRLHTRTHLHVYTLIPREAFLYNALPRAKLPQRAATTLRSSAHRKPLSKGCLIPCPAKTELKAGRGVIVALHDSSAWEKPGLRQKARNTPLSAKAVEAWRTRATHGNSPRSVEPVPLSNSTSIHAAPVTKESASNLMHMHSVT